MNSIFGLVSKKALIKRMKDIKECGKKENNGVEYPPKTDVQRNWNIAMQGYEDGHDNFYNALMSWLKRE